MLTRWIGGAAVALALLFTAPAQAVVVNSTDIGFSGTTTIGGLIENQPVAGLSGTLFLQYTGLSNNDLTWNFLYTVDNTSTGAITNSRVSSWGLNTTPNPTGVASTGLYGYAQLTPNGGGIPGFIGNVDMCAGSSAGTCTGGLGLLPGDGTASGTLSLTYLIAMDFLTLDSAYFRYQSIVGSLLGTSGAGLNSNVIITPFDVSPVPIPGAVWLFGSALAGLGLLARRKRKAQLAAA